MTDISRYRRLVRDLDFQGVEFARDEIRDAPELVEALAEEYWQLNTWRERSFIVQLVQDCMNPVLRALMKDFLRARVSDDAWADHVELTKAIAVCHVEGDYDLFPMYLDDRDRLHSDIAQLLEEQGHTITATPEPKPAG
jgi:hypothetical protein